MADMGLLAGLAEGFNRGLGSYYDQKRLLEDRARQKQNQQIQMLQAGVQQNPETQNVEFTPEKQNELKLKNTQTTRALNADTPGTQEWEQGHTLAKGLLKSANPRLTDKDLEWVDKTPNSLLHGEQGLVKPVISGQFGVREAQIRADAATNTAGIKNEGKVNKETTKAFNDFSTALDPNKGRTGNLGTLAGTVNQAQRLEALVGNSNNLTSRQVEELAIGLNKMLSGSSVSAQNQVKALVPSSALGNVEKTVEFLTNSPRGLRNQAFVNQMMDTVRREKEVASGQLKTAQYQKVAAYEHLRKSDSDQFERVLNGYGLSGDEYDKFQTSRKGGGPGLLAQPAQAAGQPAQGGPPPNMSFQQFQAWKAQNAPK